MKANTPIMLVLLFLFLGTISVAQRSEVRDLDSFSSVSVGESIDVTLIKGSSESAVIETRGIDPEDVQTSVRGDHLKIGLASGRWRDVSVNIELTYVDLDEVRVSSSADIRTDGPIKGDRLYLEASSSGDLDAEVDVDELEAEVSSSGDIVVSGKARTQRVKASSSGDYMAYDLQCEESKVSASSSGSAKVTASRLIDADATSGARIRYRGNPEKVYVDSSSGGSARKDS